MLRHIQALQVQLPRPRLPCLRFHRLRLRLRLRNRFELDPRSLLGHMYVLSQLVNLVLDRLEPPRLLPPFDPPLVPLVLKERTCSLKRLALPLVRPLVRPAPCRQGGQHPVHDRHPPVLA